MCNVVKKTFKGKQKKEWLGELTTKLLHLAPHTTLSTESQSVHLKMLI